MRAKLIILFAALLLSVGIAKTLVVYPLTSQDALLGIAVADRIALSFEDTFEVLGPEVAPALVPPLALGAGFVNPTAFLGDKGINSLAGVALLRDAIGADIVLTGRISFSGDYLQEILFVADAAGVHSFTLPALQDDPGELIDQAVALLAQMNRIAPPEAVTEVDLTGSYGDFVRAVGLLGGGLLNEAEAVLSSSLEGQEQPDPRSEGLLRDVRAVLAGEEGENPARLATMSLSRSELDEALSVSYFQRFAESSSLPSPEVWVGVLSASVNDKEGAVAAFEAAAAAYPYGLASRGSFRLADDEQAGLEDLAVTATNNSIGALLGTVSAANFLSDVELEKSALQRLTEVAPFFTFPYERLSFIAFDEENAQAAADALQVAVKLEPSSDLYWTNLGWAYYLLGSLEQSEEASLRAIKLNESEFVAHYNLGLVRAVTGRLQEAMDAYNQALRFDPEVDDEAIGDLENALQLYPNQPAIHYPLATLYDAEGRRMEAADEYESYLTLSEAPVFSEVASERLVALRAPPPPFEITPGVTLTLGERGTDEEPYHPADLLVPSFEVFTPGEELPKDLDVVVAVQAEDGGEVASRSDTVSVPQGAIGYVIDNLGVELPEDLQAGNYQAVVTVKASEDREASVMVGFQVTGEPELIRRLLGRKIVLQELQSGTPLYDQQDLARPDTLLDRLVRELRANVSAAEEALPSVTEGPFAGLSGGQLFSDSTTDDVRNFLEFLLQQDTNDVSMTFVDAYAQWALDGAPSN